VILVAEFHVKNSESLHSMPLHQRKANCLFPRYSSYALLIFRTCYMDNGSEFVDLVASLPLCYNKNWSQYYL